MRALIQRVSEARVRVDQAVVGEISRGILIFLGVGRGDDEGHAAYLVKKITELRIFEDDEGRMNLGLADIGGSLLVVSQFTLYGDTRKGRRPSFFDAMPPEHAQPLVDRFVELARERGFTVETGVFGAHMDVELVNDGPVTLWLEKT